MPRKPIGDRAMTVAERQARYLARRLAATRPSASPAFDGIQYDHLRRWPALVAAGIVRRLGPVSGAALRDALTAALDNQSSAPCSEPPADETD